MDLSEWYKSRLGNEKWSSISSNVQLILLPFQLKRIVVKEQQSKNLQPNKIKEMRR